MSYNIPSDWWGIVGMNINAAAAGGPDTGLAWIKA
jgi:hypothetical protein